MGIRQLARPWVEWFWAGRNGEKYQGPEDVDCREAYRLGRQIRRETKDVARAAAQATAALVQDGLKYRAQQSVRRIG